MIIRYITILITILTSLNIFSYNNIPRLFQLDWGLSIDNVKEQIINNKIKISVFEYYSIDNNSNELYDLKYSASVKYISEGMPLLNIPAKVIFTFYNPSGLKIDLKLSKIEILLNKKDNNGVFVDIKAVYKDLIKLFFENYFINIDYSTERRIYDQYNYQVIYNGIFVKFIANTNNNNLEKRISIYISYENNEFQNLILKKENELLNQQLTDNEKILYDVKSNL